MQFVGNERFQMTEGSTVDVYVAGNVASVGNVEVGQRYHPAAFRLYVGGRDTVTIRHLGNKRFRGAIYAPRANIEVAGNVKYDDVGTQPVTKEERAAARADRGRELSPHLLPPAPRRGRAAAASRA